MKKSMGMTGSVKPLLFFIVGVGLINGYWIRGVKYLVFLMSKLEAFYRTLLLEVFLRWQKFVLTFWLLNYSTSFLMV